MFIVINFKSVHKYVLSLQDCNVKKRYVVKKYVINRYVVFVDEGRAFLSNAFHLCKPLQKAEDVGILKSWLTDVWGNLAMVDYPYAANFLAPLPAWPIKVKLLL